MSYKPYDLHGLKELLHETVDMFSSGNDLYKIVEIQYLVDKILTLKNTSIEELERNNKRTE